jgi:hypothetical protein
VEQSSADDCTSSGFKIDGTGGSAANVMVDCSAIRAGGSSFVVGPGVVGFSLIGCVAGLTSVFAPAVNLNASGVVSGLQIVRGTVSVGDGGMLVAGAGTTVRVVASSLRPFYGPCVIVGAGAKVVIEASACECADANDTPLVGAIHVDGAADLRDVTAQASAGPGLLVGAAGVVRRENLDTSGSSTDATVTAGGVVTGFAAVKLAWAAAASLTTAVAQTVFPGTTSTTSSTDVIGYVVVAPDALGTLRVKHTGNAANVGGQTIAYALAVNGSPVATVTLAANAAASGFAVLSTMPVAAGDVVTLTATPSGILTAAVTDIQASAA